MALKSKNAPSVFCDQQSKSQKQAITSQKAIKNFFLIPNLVVLDCWNQKTHSRRFQINFHFLVV
ncbi:hypothetical protein HPPN135_07390 [Helicobacter pylori Puno135]|nr:hypothetical protein HPPN135_07390 [Helicobacter pylori Puno135]